MVWGIVFIRVIVEALRTSEISQEWLGNQRLRMTTLFGKKDKILYFENSSIHLLREL